MVNNWNIKKLGEENVKNEVDFLPADKCQTFPRLDTIILGVWPGMLKLPKKQVRCFFAAIS